MVSIVILRFIICSLTQLSLSRTRLTDDGMVYLQGNITHTLVLYCSSNWINMTHNLIYLQVSLLLM